MTNEEMKNLFVEKGLTLGSVESFTGGQFASFITKIPGASKFFKGALVTYATEEKERLLSIPHQDVVKYGVVSSEIALQMAEFGKEKLDVDYCLSFTGNAGPEAMEDKPVGLIYIGLSTPHFSKVSSFQLEGSRHSVQEKAVSLALTLIEEALKN